MAPFTRFQDLRVAPALAVVNRTELARAAELTAVVAAYTMDQPERSAGRLAQ
jgi:hypothetical protein